MLRKLRESYPTEFLSLRPSTTFGIDGYSLVSVQRNALKVRERLVTRLKQVTSQNRSHKHFWIMNLKVKNRGGRNKKRVVECSKEG